MVAFEDTFLSVALAPLVMVLKTISVCIAGHLQGEGRRLKEGQDTEALGQPAICPLNCRCLVNFLFTFPSWRRADRNRSTYLFFLTSWEQSCLVTWWVRNCNSVSFLDRFHKEAFFSLFQEKVRELQRQKSIMEKTLRQKMGRKKTAKESGSDNNSPTGLFT